MANLGNYQAAVDLFTQAINLDAKDFRFVCYPKLEVCFHLTNIASLISTNIQGRIEMEIESYC